ncbi:3'-5' exoribonuclease [Gordonia bronchialis]|uniref:3'-5' exoribonuclease domain-containing protein n=1 Tax=Gordonia bronchialis TaxID=2054 RepID=UPI001CBA7172|nr:3'-5' exoribonuclease [Gordonia bronchialis]UAK38390.1 3'-5' exoribonuclease [Gordonia bronchialis]
MRYFYDTEFLEDGKTIELISIGIVADDGREYYAVNSEAPWDRIRDDDWLMDNIVRHLPTHSTGQVRENKTFGARSKYSWGGVDCKSVLVKPKWVIRNEVREFLLHGGIPELWAWYGAYDHVVLAQLFGRMINLPNGIPMWTNDLKQEHYRLGEPELPAQAEGEHNALEDARQLKRRFDYLRGSE